MTARGTDWWLAALVALLAVTGVMTWFAATPSERWVFAVHDAGGLALGGVLFWKTRRVWQRVADRRRWDRRTGAGLAAALLVGATLGTGVAWSTGANTTLAGYTLIAWHAFLGALLAAVVFGHALARAKPLRARDVTDRRQFLTTLGVGAAAVGAWRLQRPVSQALGLGGQNRRFTGSYEDSGSGEFPVTSWLGDDPREIEAARYRLAVDGDVDAPLALAAGELDAGDELVATLDCTGGFACTRRWHGVRLDRVLARARPRASVTHVRIHSKTGYRASFPLDEAAGLLLAIGFDGEPLSHGHGAPARLVAPRRRGFQWVKWVTRLELADGPDAGAIPSTVWSTFTPEGRGRA